MEEKKKVPITVRFNPDAMQVLRDMAAEHNTSVAELVRIVVDNRMVQYLGNVKYMDYDQGKEIQQQVSNLCNLMEEIRLELNRIGVNFNQEVKLKRIERKYENRTGISAMQRKLKERDAVMQGEDLSKEELEEILNRFEAASTKVGEALCRIVE